MAFSRSSSVAGADYWALTRIGQSHQLRWPELVYLHEPRLTLHSPRVHFRAAAHHAYIWDFSLCPRLEYLGKLHVGPLLSFSQFYGLACPNPIREIPNPPSSLPHIYPHSRKSCPTEKVPFLELVGLIFPPPPCPPTHFIGCGSVNFSEHSILCYFSVPSTPFPILAVHEALLGTCDRIFPQCDSQVQAPRKNVAYLALRTQSLLLLGQAPDPAGPGKGSSALCSQSASKAGLSSEACAQPSQPQGSSSIKGTEPSGRARGAG